MSGVDAVEDRRADEGAVRVVAGRRPSTTSVGARLDAAVDAAADALARGARDHRADVDALVEAVADPQRLGGLRSVAASAVVGVADRDHHRAGHAALAGGAEGASRRCSSTVLSMTASGITTMWFLAPPSACTRLPAAAARS